MRISKLFVSQVKMIGVLLLTTCFLSFAPGDEKERPDDGKKTAACDISAVTFSNQGACNNNCTPNDNTDDYYTIDMTVDFTDPPASGTLRIEPGNPNVLDIVEIPVGSLVGNSHTFTGVRLRANGSVFGIEVEFSADNACVLTVIPPVVNGCSTPCNISSASFSNVGTCNDNGTAGNATDDFFTADLTVNFTNPPCTGTLRIEPGNSNVLDIVEIPVGSLVGNSHTFTAVRLRTTGGIFGVEIEFSDLSLACVRTIIAPVVFSCSPPCTLTCPANITVPNAPNQCGAVVTFPAATPSSAGVCGTVVSNPASGSFFLVGTTTVTATSASGNTCTFTVTVLDVQAPAVTCPSNSIVSNDPNQCGAVVNFTLPIATDNCPGVNTVSANPASGSFFPVGATIVTVTASDTSPDSPDGSCTFTVTVNDTQAPSITCPGNQTRTANAPGCTWVSPNTALDPATSDNCPGLTRTYTLTGVTTGSGNTLNGVTFNRGVTNISWTATDAAGNSVSCSFIMTVVSPVSGTIINSGGQSICAGQNGSLNIFVAGVPNFSAFFNIAVINGTGVATPSFGPVTIVNAGPSAVTIPTANLINTSANTTIYRISWVSLTDANGCTAMGGGLTGFEDIIVYPTPAIAVTPLQGTINTTGYPVPSNTTLNSVCPGTTLTFTITDPTNTVGAAYNWIAKDALGNTLGTPAYNQAFGVPLTTNLGLTSTACGINNPVTFTFTPVGAGPLNCQGTAVTRDFNIRDNTAPVFTTVAGSLNTTVECGNASQLAAANAFGPPSATDNCGLVGSIAATKVSGSFVPGGPCPFVGIYTNTWRATDACGNSTVFTQTITVRDITAPTFTSAVGSLNTTIECGNNPVLFNNLLNSAQVFAPTFTDACGIPTLTKSAGIFAQANMGPCVNAGTYTNTFTVTDACGNSTTFTQVITITDNTAPAMFNPGPQNLDIGAGANCTVPIPNYVTTLNFPGNTVDCNPTINFTQSPLAGTNVTGTGGQITVTITATDGCGNSSVRTFIVNLVDQTAPNAICRASQGFGVINANTVYVSLNAQGNSTLNTAFFNNNSTDNCTPAANLQFTLSSPGFEGILYPPYTFTCNDVGPQVVRMIVTDAFGNTGFCDVNVIVRDVTPPVFTCPGTQTLGKGANCTSTLPNYVTMLPITATDACGNTPLVYATAIANTTQPGTITQTPVPGTIYGSSVTSQVVTIRATDANGNSATCTFTVNFVDIIPPTISCNNPSNITVTTGAGNTNCSVVVNYAAPTAQDNCATPFPGAITPVRIAGPASGSLFFVGVTTITYEATDGAGNTSRCTFMVTVTDNTIPTIQCTGNKTVSAGAGCLYTHNNNLWNSSAQDNCLLATPAIRYSTNGGLTYPYTTVNAVSFGLGITTVIARATDASGNAATCSFTVTVIDNQVPTITCPGNITIAANTGPNCRAIVNLPPPVTVENCTSVVEWFITGATPNSSGLGVLTSFIFNSGGSQVQYRISDAAGNSTTCSFNVTVTNNIFGAITGTSTVAQNVMTTSTITFTASGGTPNYTFAYDISVNGGPFGAVQSVSTTGGQSIVTVAQSNAIIGSFTYRLIGVTDANGCAGTLIPPVTATVTVVSGVPDLDLTTSQFFTTLQINPGGVIDEVIALRNVGGGPTTGPIIFSITNYSALSGLTITSNPAANITIGLDTFPLDNANWTFNPVFGTFTSGPGVVILPAGVRNIGIRITRGTGAAAGTPGAVTQTTTVQPGTGGGESPISNNSISNTLIKN